MGESAEYDADTLEALPVGTTISGYAIRRIIGHGGFGITYEAYNAVTRKAAAIKEFFPSSLVRRDGNSGLIYSKANTKTITWALGKFEETTTTLCGLKHPNIVEVYDYVPANDTGYMIMELLDGQTLEHWLTARAQPPCLDELRPVLDPVMEALGYLHGLGLIHRDIAPDNILITREGRPVLIDFGSVSRDLSDAQQKAMSSTIGMTKRNYTAPEQSRAKARPTPEADIYSMGAVLYRALSGDKPADGQDRVDAIFHEKGLDPYEPLMKHVPAGCTTRAAQAIDTALAVNPERRLHRIADLRTAMVPPAVAPASPKTMPVKWLAAAALAVVLATVGGALAGVHWAREDNRAAQATLDGERGDMGRVEADLTRQQAALAADKGDLAKQRDGVDAAKAEVDRNRAAVEADRTALATQREGIGSAKAEVDRDRAAVEAEKTDLATQRDGVDAAKAEVERNRAAVEADKSDLAKQHGDVATAQAEVARDRAEIELAKAEVARQRGLLDAGNDRDNAAMRAAQAEVDQKRKEAEQAKADLAQANQALQTAQGQLAQQRVQLSDSQAQADDANRRREAAEADASHLRDQVQSDAAAIDGQRSELREKDDEVARLTTETERLRRSIPGPGTSATANSDPTALSRKAREATVIFYDKHSYSEGGSLDGLLELYPAGQTIIVNGAERSGRDQIAALLQYYKQRNYTVFDIRAEPGSFDFSECQSLENCVVKGMTQSTYQTVDNATPRGGPSNFCLRFNLRGSPKVLAEASTKPGKVASCE